MTLPSRLCVDRIVDLFLIRFKAFCYLLKMTQYHAVYIGRQKHIKVLGTLAEAAQTLSEFQEDVGHDLKLRFFIFRVSPLHEDLA